MNFGQIFEGLVGLRMGLQGEQNKLKLKKELYEEHCKNYITKFREKYYKLYPDRRQKSI